jgi:hypothetical protein
MKYYKSEKDQIHNHRLSEFYKKIEDSEKAFKKGEIISHEDL